MPVIDLTKRSRPRTAGDDGTFSAVELEHALTQAGSDGSVVLPAPALRSLLSGATRPDREATLFGFAEKALLIGLQLQIHPDDAFGRDMVRVARAIYGEIDQPTDRPPKPQQENDDHQEKEIQ